MSMCELRSMSSKSSLRMFPQSCSGGSSDCEEQSNSIAECKDDGDRRSHCDSSSTGCCGDFDELGPLEPSSVLLNLLIESCNTDKEGKAGISTILKSQQLNIFQSACAWHTWGIWVGIPFDVTLIVH